MNPLRQIEAGGTIAYKVAYAKLPGSDPIVAIFLSQVAYWSARFTDGWCWITHDNLEEQTGISQKQQDRAAKVLSGLGVLEKQLKGIPAKINYRVDFEKLATLLSQKGKPVLAETANLLYKEKITEETTEREVAAPPEAPTPPETTPVTAPEQTVEDLESDQHQLLTQPPNPPSRRKKIQYLRDNPPTIEQCREVASEHEEAEIVPAVEAEKFHAFHTSLGWVSSKGRPYITLSGVYGTWVANWKKFNPREYTEIIRLRQTAARAAQPFVSEIAQIKARQRAAAAARGDA